MQRDAAHVYFTIKFVRIRRLLHSDKTSTSVCRNGVRNKSKGLCSRCTQRQGGAGSERGHRARRSQIRLGKTRRWSGRRA